LTNSVRWERAGNDSNRPFKAVADYVSVIMIIDVVMFKVFNGSVSNDAEQEQHRRCCELHYAVGLT
jgi:hypothetical protein